MDPLSITLATISVKAGEAILTGIIGNRSDDLLMKSFKKIQQITTLKNKEFPENHDLLRTLRKSMLTATDMIRLNMKEEGQQKKFRKELKSWIDDQIKLLQNLENWAEWSNPASEELELFFANEKKYTDRKLLLTKAMTKSWESYLELKLSIDLPNEFKTKLENGWYEEGDLLKWDEAVIVLMIEALRDETNEMGKRASKAFEHNFLSEIKLELESANETTSSIEMQIRNVYQKMLIQFENVEVINQLSKTISSQQNVIESQQKSIENLSKLQLNQLKNSLFTTRKELTALGFKYDDCLQKANELTSINIDAAKQAFMKSAEVLNEIIQLYESSRGFISSEKKTKLDNLLSAARGDKKNDADDQLTSLIKFVQLFDQTINQELGSS